MQLDSEEVNHTTGRLLLTLLKERQGQFIFSLF